MATRGMGVMDNIFDIGAILAFIGSLIALFFNHRTAVATAQGIEVDTDGKYQEQINRLVKANGDLFAKIESMREMYEERIDAIEALLENERRARDKERQEYDAHVRGMTNDILNMKTELRAEQERNRSAISRTRSELGVVKEDVRRITGPLPYPPDKEKPQ